MRLDLALGDFCGLDFLLGVLLVLGLAQGEVLGLDLVLGEVLRLVLVQGEILRLCQQNYDDWSFAASTLWSIKMAGKREQVRALVHSGPLNCKAYGSRELPSF